MTTTAWGKATVVEQVSIKQSAEGRAFETLVQLLERSGPPEGGGRAARALLSQAVHSDSMGGTARRGPVTLRRDDIDRMRKALAKAPRPRWTA